MKLVSIRKLAILDMAIHGRPFVVTEFVGAVLLCIFLGGYILIHAPQGYGVWLDVALIGIGFNYMPLAFYVLSKKSHTLHDEDTRSLEVQKRYTIQSLFLAIPFFIFVVAVFQKIKDLT
jgi:hypothetical protein